MAGSAVQASINRVWRDGPATEPHEPEKPEIRDDFGATLASEIDSIIASVDDAVEDLTGLITTGVKLPFDPVVFRTTTTGALATAFVAGTVHDGHTAVAGERFFMDGRTNGAEHGLYTVPASGAPTRTTDADQGAELPGTYFLVSQGTVAAGNVYACATPGPITLGTTVLKFVKTGQSQSAVLPTLSAGAPVTDPVDTQFVLLNAAGTAPLRISWADLLAKFNGEVMGPQTYVWPAHRVVRTTAIDLIPLDAGLQRFDVVNTSDAWAWIAEGGVPATVGGFGSVGIPPKGVYSTDFALPGSVSAISQGEVLLTVKFKTTTNYNAAARATAKEYTDAVGEIMTGSLTTAQTTVLQDFYAALYSAGVLSTAGVMYNLLAPGLATSINLCDVHGPRSYTVGTITRTNWRYMTFDGVSGYQNTRRFMSEIARDIDHSVFVYPGSTALQGSSRVAIGDATILVTPNRTSTSVAGRSSSSSLLTASGFTTAPALLSLSRTSVDKATFRQGLTTKVDVADPVTLPIQTREILIGARNTGTIGGAAEPSAGSFFSGPMVLAGAGRALSDAAHAAIHNATAKLILDASAF